MLLRCPHCQNQVDIDFAEEEPLAEMTCPACGSTFHLISGESTETHRGADSRTIAHFQLIEHLGQGHMGSVWKSLDTKLDRTVAVKIPRKEHLAPEDLAQFLREARAAAQLRHPNIVPVYEVGSDGGTVYLVSEYVPGLTLADWLTGHRPQPREAAELCAKLADAVHHAHECGVIHRDLKPSNILLDAQLEPHITDFGLAKREAGEVTITVEGKILGTPAYMSPEQASGEGHAVDRRTDIYSLGVILFELLTGQRPFRGSIRMLLKQVIEEPAPRLRKLDKRIPRDLETICLKCLEKEPAGRYASGADMAAELRRYLAGEPIHSRPISTAARTWRWCRRNPVVAGLTAVAFVLLVFLTLMVWIVLNRQQEPQLAQIGGEDVRDREQDSIEPLQREGEDLMEQRDRLLREIARLKQVIRIAEDEEQTRIARERGSGTALPTDTPRVTRGAPETVEVRDLVAVEPEEPRVRINAGGHMGVVQGLAFAGKSNRSDRLCSAGDKVVHVWNVSVLTRDPATAFLPERTIRWHVARGPAGQIYALAYDAKRGLLALGGQAAMPPWGRIVLVEPRSGKLMHVLVGHLAPLLSLAFSPDGEWLASADLAGQILLWKRGTWKPVEVLKPDDQQYGKDIAAAIERETGGYRSRSVAFAGNEWLVVPVYVRQTSAGRLVWKLEQVSVADPAVRYDLAPGGVVQEQFGMVTALAGSRSVVRIASADMAAQDNVCVWDWLNQALRVRRLDAGALVRSLALSPDGRTLAVGTERPSAAGKGASKARAGPQLQLWDAETFQRTSTRDVPDVVAACAITDDGAQIAYAGGLNGEVYCGPLDGSSPPRALRGHGRRVWRVAFAAKDPPYRVAFGTELRYRGPNDYGDLSETFNTETSAVGRGALEAADWIAPDYGSADWTAERLADGTLQLANGGKPGGRIAFNLGSDLVEGRANSWCFVPDRQGRPFAIAVATTDQNSIYVFRLNAEPGQACPVLRRFRGHEDMVTSVGVSLNSEYLVSGSVDGTVCFWSLAGLDQGETVYGSWGAELTLDTRGELVAWWVHPDGPLSAKGVREGDVLREIRWFEGYRESKHTQPEAMRKKLQSLPRGTEVYFRFSRGETVRPWFALRHAWQAMATLFVGDDGEYAFWAPAGYYDASANGRSLFGWQVNPRTFGLLPQFYRADQFRTLERPKVMRVLLRSGNLREALLRCNVQPKVALHDTLTHYIAQTPKVEILDPAVDTVVEGKVARVKARVEVPAGAKLVGVNVYASGVMATKPPSIQPLRPTEKGHEVTYEFEVPLPAEERTLIEVLAETEETVGFGEVVVYRRKIP